MKHVDNTHSCVMKKHSPIHPFPVLALCCSRRQVGWKKYAPAVFRSKAGYALYMSVQARLLKPLCPHPHSDAEVTRHKNINMDYTKPR